MLFPISNLPVYRPRVVPQILPRLKCRHRLIRFGALLWQRRMKRRTRAMRLHLFDNEALTNRRSRQVIHQSCPVLYVRSLARKLYMPKRISYSALYKTARIQLSSSYAHMCPEYALQFSRANVHAKIARLAEAQPTCVSCDNESHESDSKHVAEQLCENHCSIAGRVQTLTRKDEVQYMIDGFEA
jgi:hypothetical protein